MSKDSVFCTWFGLRNQENVDVVIFALELACLVTKNGRLRWFGHFSAVVSTVSK